MQDKIIVLRSVINPSECGIVEIFVNDSNKLKIVFMRRLGGE
jgi:hypothetical protein